MTQQYHIYSIGNALVDFEIETKVEELQALDIEKGVMTLIEKDRQQTLMNAFKGQQHSRACGGSAANSIIGAQTLGSKCFYSCKVGGDETGEFYRDDLLSHGVKSNLETEVFSDGDTGKCLVMVTDDADRTMNTYLGVTGDLSYQQVDETALSNSQYLYVEGYLSSSPLALEASVKTMAFAHSKGIKTAFSLSDPNMVKFCRAGLDAIIGEGVDLLFCNEDEALMYAQSDKLEDAVAKLSIIAKTLVITLGPKGSLIVDQGKQITIDGHPVTAIDSNGAGDLFAGSFLNAICRGLSLKQAGELASFASAQLVTQYGPRLNAEKLALVKAFAAEQG